MVSPNGRSHVHRDRRNRNVVGTNSSFGTSLLCGSKCALKQVLQLPRHSPGSACDGEGFFHLAQNLRLAHHHGVEAGSHAEKMAHRLLITVVVNVRRQLRRINAEVAVKKRRQVGVRILERGQQLHPIAGGNDHALANARHVRQRARCFRQILTGDRDPLAQRDGRGLVIHSYEYKSHCGPNLCTWLKRLAAQTAIITIRTAPERYAAFLPRNPADRRTKRRKT